MASAKENVPLAPRTTLLPQQTSDPRPPPPRRPKVAAATTTEPAPAGGVLKCTCFRLPSRSKNKPLPPPPAMAKLSNASRRSSVAPDDASRSQRVTFRASASLSTWWPASPSAAGDTAAGAGGTLARGAGGGSVVAPRRASASSASGAPPRYAAAAGAPSSSSFSHWRRSVSSRVTPHGGRASFSFPTSSPASASSSCMSTPKIPQGFLQG